MKGNYSGGVYTATWQANGEKLEGPADSKGNRQHWIPCDTCEELTLVAWNVVNIVCDECSDDDGNEVEE